MNDRERYLKTMAYEPVDCRPFHAVPVWVDTLARWKTEGLPAEVTDVHAYLGVEVLPLTNVSGCTAPFPAFEQKTIKETGEEIVYIDGYGRTVHDFKKHTSMPEWIDFPVKEPKDLERVLEEHYSLDRLDERFSNDWKKRLEQIAANDDALVLIDGGCYYWTLRSLAGVENASYLFYDAPELVDELFERYCLVTLEGIRRASEIVKIDLLGYGEDIACKNGPLMSPDMFREIILPRYRRALDLAKSKGITGTWYDSDGDLTALMSDYLSADINTLAPCEVAANMDPVALRKKFGKELRMIGGIDKRQIAKGPDAIKAELDRLRPVVREGGFIPAIDHSVAADISWDNYRFYIDEMRSLLSEVE